MWFKQVQLFQIDETIDCEVLEAQLQSLAFHPCLPSHHYSRGFVEPVETNQEENILARRVGDYVMLCLQLEEKILPASVIREALADKVSEIARREDRKVRGKERLALKDEVIFSLLPRAFTKKSKIYGYIDLSSKRLVLGTVAEKKAEHFVSMLRKAVGEEIYAIETEKLSPKMTHWVRHQDYPTVFSVQKAGVLQDPEQASRVIRCKAQDLFAKGIQSLLSDGCEVRQLALQWHDQVDFILSEGLLLQSVRLSDDVALQSKELELESKEQQFDADFMIMAKTFSGLFLDLLPLFTKTISINTPELVE